MFGVLRGAGCGLGESGRREWMGHICGVCLALGREHGQAARLATGYDAALLAALVEAQAEQPAARVSHLCPLRPGLRGDVADPAGPAARYGAAAALMIAAARIGDDVADGDAYARLPGVAAIGRAAGGRAARSMRALGVDPTALAAAGPAQPAVEVAGAGLLESAEPAARACAAAFAHTALLAGAPANQAALGLAGRAYGRIIYLLDAVRDRRDDAARGRFNPLLAADAPAHAPLFRAWHAELLAALDAAALARPELVHGLLDGGLLKAWRGAERAEISPRKAGRRAPGGKRGWCEGWCDGCHGCGDLCSCCVDCGRCGGKCGRRGGGSDGCCDINCCDGDCGCCGCDCCDCNCN